HATLVIPPTNAGCLRNVGCTSVHDSIVSYTSRTNSGPASSGGTNSCKPPTCMGCSRDSPSRNMLSVGEISSIAHPCPRASFPITFVAASKRKSVMFGPAGLSLTGRGQGSQMGLTVAVTGPTGEIGVSAVTALEREPSVERIIGMARRPFDTAAQGWEKTEYREGDILDRDAVDGLVADADVVVHLAFIIMGSRAESARVNLAGTRNVFEATVAAPRVRRLVYTSSVAAYGYHSDNPVPLT